MGFLLQPHGATCTEQQSCATARGRGREIFLAGAHFCKSCTEQALSHQHYLRSTRDVATAMGTKIPYCKVIQPRYSPHKRARIRTFHQ